MTSTFTSHLKSVFDQAHAQLALINPTPLLEARMRHRVLRHIKTVPRLLQVLQRQDRWGSKRRHSIVLVILKEHRQHPQPFWSLVLLVVLSPMLNRLRLRLLASDHDPDDLDQLILEHFIEVINTCDLMTLQDKTALRIRRAVERRVFRALKQVQAESSKHRNLCKQVELFQFNPFDEVDDEDLSEFLATLFCKMASSRLSSDRFDLVLNTVVLREPLRDYAKRLTSEYDAEATHELLYQRLKRRRTRALDVLQKSLKRFLHLYRQSPTSSDLMD